MLQKLLAFAVFALTSLLTLPLAYGAQRAPTPAETVTKETTTHLSLGGSHTCQLGAGGDGVVRCWGSNGAGQLGDGTTTDRNTPVSGLGSLLSVAVAAGGGHTCVLSVGGFVSCWGGNLAGQLGDGTTTNRLSATTVRGLTSGFLTGVEAIAAGGAHTCGLLADGDVLCWGFNSRGQLGDGTTTNRLTPVAVRQLFNQIAIAAGAEHTCALSADGTVRCWGNNGFGQLGDGSTTTRLVPGIVSLPLSAVAITAGFSHTCAVLVDGTSRCWGDNRFGQVGDDTTTTRFTPEAVIGLNNVVAMAAGNFYTCALLADSTARCWGSNESGKLGDGSLTNRLRPVLVSGVFGATAIAAGGGHTCALLASGITRCWGANGFGQIGDGTAATRLTAVPVSGVAGSALAARVAVGEHHSCAVRDNGTAACWGGNTSGQLGDGTTANSFSPTAVRGLTSTSPLTGVMAVAAGDFHTCVQLANSVRCWGDNQFGQLGDGTTATRLTSVAVSGVGGTAVALVAGDFHNCLLSTDGTVRCWGLNNVGQIGDGTTGTNRLTPVPVVGLTDVKAVAAGSGHSCALLGDGAVRCWGRNDFLQLGRAGPGSPLPVVVNGLNNVVALAAGDLHTCALLPNGDVACWGANHFGQLGNGGVAAAQLPTIALTGPAVALAAGAEYTCALLANGTVECWGANDVGQVGDGTTRPHRPFPTQVLRFPQPPGGVLQQVAQIATGTGTSCARFAQGSVACWGWNVFGQVGDGTTIDRTIPVVVPSFTFNINPQVSLRRNEKSAIVNVQAVCQKGQRLRVAVSLTQGSVIGEGHGQGECTGGLGSYPVHVHTRHGEEFEPGEARAEAVGEVRSRSDIVEEQQWSRQVTIGAEP